MEMEHKLLINLINRMGELQAEADHERLVAQHRNKRSLLRNLRDRLNRETD